MRAARGDFAGTAAPLTHAPTLLSERTFFDLPLPLPPLLLHPPLLELGARGRHIAVHTGSAASAVRVDGVLAESVGGDVEEVARAPLLLPLVFQDLSSPIAKVDIWGEHNQHISTSAQRAKGVCERRARSGVGDHSPKSMTAIRWKPHFAAYSAPMATLLKMQKPFESVLSSFG